MHKQLLSYTIYEKPNWRIGLSITVGLASLSRTELTTLINELQSALSDMEKRMTVEKRK